MSYFINQDQAIDVHEVEEMVAVVQEIIIVVEVTHQAVDVTKETEITSTDNIGAIIKPDVYMIRETNIPQRIHIWGTTTIRLL